MIAFTSLKNQVQQYKPLIPFLLELQDLDIDLFKILHLRSWSRTIDHNITEIQTSSSFSKKNQKQAVGKEVGS